MEVTYRLRMRRVFIKYHRTENQFEIEKQTFRVRVKLRAISYSAGVRIIRARG